MKRVGTLALLILAGTAYLHTQEAATPKPQNPPAHPAAARQEPPAPTSPVPATPKTVAELRKGGAGDTVLEGVDPNKAKYLSEHLKTLNVSAQLAQTNYQSSMGQLQQDFAQTNTQFAQWEKDVRAANGWDDSYTYDRTKETWSHSTRPAAVEPPKAPGSPISDNSVVPKKYFDEAYDTAIALRAVATEELSMLIEQKRKIADLANYIRYSSPALQRAGLK